MAGLLPAIHALHYIGLNSWMPGTSAGHDESIEGED
jgi:hypothetical protein